MVQQLFNEVERLKAEVKRLRGKLDSIAVGNQVILNPNAGQSSMPPPASGALIYGTAAPEWGRRAIGAEGEVLQVQSGFPVWDAAPAGTPSATVEDETTFGISPSAGASNDYSRGDHTHGTPADPGGGFSIGAILQNEVKAWPPLIQIGSGFDLVTNNHWWDDEGTPTTKATAVPSSGEAGLDAKFTEVIKCVTDAANEGFSQRYTYANEPRVKSGSVLSALVWVATTTGGTGITVKLRNSGGSSTSGTSIATDGDWSLISVENHTCSGTYVELVVTKDASGTFYAGGPITVMIGTTVIGLPPRKEIYRWRNVGADHDIDYVGDTGGFTDANVSSIVGALATRAQMNSSIGVVDGSANYTFELAIRFNGSSITFSESNSVAFARTNTSSGRDSARSYQTFTVLLDDAGIFEYDFNKAEGASNADGSSGMSVLSYWEWE